MGNSGWTADPADLTIPPDAGTTDPRIYIGPNDPIAQSLSQDAAIVFYFAQDRAFFLSVEQSGGPDDGQLHLWCTANDIPGNFHQLVDIDYDVTNDSVQFTVAAAGLVQDVTFQCFARRIELQDSLSLSKANNDILVFGESLARGWHARASSTAVLAGVTVAAGETDALVTPGEDYYGGRAYEVTMRGGTRSGTAGGAAQFRLRKTTAGGDDLGEFYRTPITIANTVFGAFGTRVFRVAAGNPVNAQIALTIQANVNTCDHFATADSPREIVIKDCGSADKYPNAPFLT